MPGLGLPLLSQEEVTRRNCSAVVLKRFCTEQTMNIRTRIGFTPVPGAEKYGVKYRLGPIGQNGQPQLGDEVVLEFPADDLTLQAPYPMGCMGNFVFIDINAPEGNFVA